ncbi:hypothetical protein [Nocardioides sp. Leaf374]|uniref:hypothetical protein n=1 Tax=Nocardioides sp. Leaf374 TaxID=2876560 RepID=UPI001E28D9B3|nr:hypothetical protein [Nocardioides sp. Leaf374]
MPTPAHPRTSTRGLALAATGLLLLVPVGAGALAPAHAAGRAAPSADSTADLAAKPPAKPGKGPGAKPGKGSGANPGKGPGANPGKGPGANPGKGPGANPGKGPGANPGKGPGANPGKGPAADPGQGPGDGAGGTSPQGEDPAGNNGTVKIAPLGEIDSIPQNTPHPGCTFQVEWYGFDEGEDIVSSVGFAMQAPTGDVGLEVDGPLQVPVGGDPASGAGTDTGLDGTQAYTLSFTGDPHPQQGYHVKLTVATPGSQGNDTKTKVFWVEPCEEPARSEGASGGAGSTEAGSGVLDAELSADADAATSGTDVGTATATSADEAPDTSDASAVPSAVDAGDGGVLADAVDWVRSPLPLLVIGLGVLLAAAGVVTQRRARTRG